MVMVIKMQKVKNKEKDSKKNIKKNTKDVKSSNKKIIKKEEVVKEVKKVEEFESINKKDKWNSKKVNLITGISTIIVIVLIIVLSFGLTYKNAERVNVSDVKLWLAYENSIESIVYNMESITNSEDGEYWTSLKDFDIEDDTYEETLNLFVVDIKECYDEFTLASDKYKDGNPILKYREMESISIRELEQLREDITKSTCMTRFDKYNDMKISDDKDIKIRFMKRIEILQEIYINEMLVKNEPSFDTLLTRKIIEASEIEGASAWLRSEYYRLK